MQAVEPYVYSIFSPRQSEADVTVDGYICEQPDETHSRFPELLFGSLIFIPLAVFAHLIAIIKAVVATCWEYLIGMHLVVRHDVLSVAWYLWTVNVMFKTHQHTPPAPW